MRVVFFFLLLTAGAATAQQYKQVDFKTLSAAIAFDVPAKKVLGTATYEFEVLEKTDTIYIDAQNMEFANVRLNGKKKTGWLATNKQLKLFKGFKKGKNTLTLSYTVQPKQALYFVKDGTDDQIWTQGQGKYTSHWLPSFDDVNEKLIFKLSVKYQHGYTVLANGKLKAKTGNNDGTQTWLYEMDKPMSSYLAMLSIGRFTEQQETSSSGTPMAFYIRKEDSLKMEPTYRYSRRIFDFLERETGYAYPWGVYRQVPALDFLYGGMENTTSTIFSQDYVVDSIGFNDRTYINVNAHELAHQWFGDLITAQSSTHHWLQEGFATYYALLAEQDLYGDDHFYYELYEMAERLQQASKRDTIAIMNEKASTLTFYQKGAWALHVLREGVGIDNFRKAVKSYLEKYAFKNVVTDEFLAEIKAVAPDYDTEGFKKRWLQSGTFEVQEALELLSKNKFMQQYLALGDLDNKAFAENKEQYLELMKSDVYFPVKEEILYQCSDVPYADKAEIIAIAMNSGDVKLRQSVARTVTKIPAEFEAQYWSLLDDKSYITQEIVLNVLYKNFPKRRTELLDKTKNLTGFNDMNLRILWLTLAYVTPGYNEAEKPEFYARLQEFATPKYESTVRTNAFANLLYIGKADPIVWENLVNATLHYKWQFVKYAKDKLRELLKKPGYREHFEGLLPQLKAPERAKLQQLLDEK
ncbi:aminopeptidase [Flavobacterium akiainvivens]|uniref:Aminopeptidase N n=1 Tax=Flavobacterium akiainvivens TaxID=1202724 RepID=A0A0M8MGF3_9FLAO|nr:M1 family metallopeptidase [Flavobacterium akiainvivens]KOS05058.1 aminopeptidase [Flavobacterium akiainvivens]SFQ52089.1 aminopeptidase N [Flavobacterium akiainvivens]